MDFFREGYLCTRSIFSKIEGESEFHFTINFILLPDASTAAHEGQHAAAMTAMVARGFRPQIAPGRVRIPKKGPWHVWAPGNARHKHNLRLTRNLRLGKCFWKVESL